MHVNIEESWAKILKSEFEKDYFLKLIQFVKQEYHTHVCYPPGPEIFNAFNICPLENVRVVILGQDPYHEPGQAEGLCFSVKPGVPLPPSLINIFKEVQQDIGVIPPLVYRQADGTFSTTPLPMGEGLGVRLGSLRRWAEQGVFLLNATLTVREHQAGSHQKQGWETFTDAVIKAISDNKEHVVFILWGGYARSKKSLIDTSKHLVLESVHPSPLSANRGGWFGNHHFSKCNEYLTANGLKEIAW